MVFFKGFTTGLLAGAVMGGVMGALADPIKDSDSKKLKKNAGSLIHSVGTILDGIMEMRH